MEIFQDGELEEAMRKSDRMQANGLASWWRLFNESYEELIQSITNPVRATYNVADLGETSFLVTPTTGAAPFAAVRDDLELVNARGEKLACSFWHRRVDAPATLSRCGSVSLPSSPTAVASPQWHSSYTTHRSSIDNSSFGAIDTAFEHAPAAQAAAAAPPCILYLHDLSSSRKECVYLRDAVLTAGFSLFALDLSGSGCSDGARVSFGHLEQLDVRAALDHLFATGKASRVGIWGRGIGGAAALLHLRAASSLSYRSLVLTKPQALALDMVDDAATGQLLCVRPSSLRLPWRLTRADVSNGDFVLLSIDNVSVRGLSATECVQRMRGAPADHRLRLAGYATKTRDDELQTFVGGLTLDCTFGDMEQVISDMLLEISLSAQRRDLVFPSAMLTAAAKIISRSVRKSGGYSLSDVNVMDDVGAFRYPSLFVCATKKDFIAPLHTIALFDAYGGPKTLHQFTGVHDQNRPHDVVERVMDHFTSVVATPATSAAAAAPPSTNKSKLSGRK